jgi:hypothetical protein
MGNLNDEKKFESRLITVLLWRIFRAMAQQGRAASRIANRGGLGISHSLCCVATTLAILKIELFCAAAMKKSRGLRD